LKHIEKLKGTQDELRVFIPLPSVNMGLNLASLSMERIDGGGCLLLWQWVAG